MALALVASVFACSCARQVESELLDVRDVGPERVELSTRLRVVGSGFPTGRTATLRVEGVLRAPGVAPRDVSVDLVGRALSTDVVEVPMTAAALRALGRGTLHGRVTVAFPATGGTAVLGRSPPVTLDLIPPSADAVDTELSLRRRAEALSRALGLVLGEELADSEGLPVERVEGGSAAARAGIVAGDRVFSVEGIRLHALTDFVPPSTAEALHFVLARADHGGRVDVVVEPRDERFGLSAGALRIGQAALVWVLLVALLFAPTASGLDWLSTPTRASTAERRDSTTGGRARRARAQRALARQALGALFFASVFGLALHGLLRVPLEAIVVSVLVARALAAGLGAPASEPLRARLASLGGALGASLLAAVAVGALGAAGGTTDVVALHDLQGAWPWEWTALRSPAGPLVVVLVVASGAFGKAAQGGLARPLATALDELVALFLSALLASVMLGGWSTGPAEGLAASCAGGLLFVVKGLVAWEAMSRAGRVAGRSWKRLAGLALVAAVVAGGWVVFEPPAEVERALAEALTVVGCALGFAFAHRRFAGRTPRAAPAHPFL